jgi:hypothetical protein
MWELIDLLVFTLNVMCLQYLLMQEVRSNKNTTSSRERKTQVFFQDVRPSKMLSTRSLVLEIHSLLECGTVCTLLEPCIAFQYHATENAGQCRVGGARGKATSSLDNFER